MKRQKKRLVVVLVLTAIAAGTLAAVMYLRPNEHRPVATMPATPAIPERTAPPAATPAPTAAPAASALPAASAAPSPAATPAVSADAVRQGQALRQAGKLLEARSVLSAAIFSGTLSAQDESLAVAEANMASQPLILSSELFEGDSYAYPYMVKVGDTLTGASGIVESSKLYVPARGILMINRLQRGEDIRPGQRLKLVRGPFHAMVSKSKFTMDLYIQRDGGEKIFLKRVKVGLGKNDSTPMGEWRLAAGKKQVHPDWTTPPGSGLREKIQYGEEGYTFGSRGLWIALEGTEEKTRSIAGIGIHSTNDPNSIGKANSLGCVRMSDDDIELVFSLLYDGRSVFSTVQIVP